MSDMFYYTDTPVTESPPRSARTRRTLRNGRKVRLTYALVVSGLALLLVGPVPGLEGGM